MSQAQTVSAASAGTITLGGDLTVHRLGYGAMRITGKGIWGPPADKDAALATLRRAVELGVNFIDTADSYGPYLSEELIAEALYPYPAGVIVATKGEHNGKFSRVNRAAHICTLRTQRGRSLPPSLSSRRAPLLLLVITFIVLSRTLIVPTPVAAVASFTEYPVTGSASDITTGPDGNLWFTEGISSGASSIGKSTPAGVITEFPLAANRGPADITAGLDNALWFVEFSVGKIGRTRPVRRSPHRGSPSSHRPRQVPSTRCTRLPSDRMGTFGSRRGGLPTRLRGSRPMGMGQSPSFQSRRRGADRSASSPDRTGISGLLSPVRGRSDGSTRRRQRLLLRESRSIRCRLRIVFRSSSQWGQTTPCGSPMHRRTPLRR